MAAFLKRLWTLCLLPTAMLTSLLRRMCNLRTFLKLGVPEASKSFLRRASGGVAAIDMLHFGRVFFVKNPLVADQIFRSPHFSNRMGEEAGLRRLGMFEQGIIWNNDLDKWEAQRKLFVRATQHKVNLEAARAFRATLREACSLETNGGDEPPPLSNRTVRGDLQGLNSGQECTLDALNVLRCCTFRVVLELMLGLTVDFLTYRETLQFVYKVNAYFKAWEHFLLRPSWLVQLCIFLVPNLGQQSRRHSGAVHELRVAVRDLVARARGRCPLGTFLADCLARYESGKSSEDKMVQMVLEMILAGTDTSSVTMFYLILAARDDPDLERMLLEEATTGGKPHGRESTPVLAAALNESMRSKPVGPVVIRRATADHFVCVGGSIPPFTIRKGDSVVIDLASMHSDAEVFDAPDGFDAVRNFLDARGREQHKFRPFGHGRKGCVGHLLADEEMRALMTCWFQTFTLVRGRGDRTLQGLETRWEIASQPTKSERVRVRIRNTACLESGSVPAKRMYLTGAHGTGKTTLAVLMRSTPTWRTHHQISEVARSVMRAGGIFRSDLADDAKFAWLQEAIADAQIQAEGAVSHLLSDRCVVDPLAYLGWRFGVDSDQFRHLVNQETVRRQIATLQDSATSLVILVAPFPLKEGGCCEDDGFRLQNSYADLQNLTAVYEKVLALLQIPFCKLEAESPEGRLQEVLRLCA